MTTRRAAFAAILLVALAAAAPAASVEIAPFKDELFRYPEPVASSDGGAVLDVPYDEARDIDRRDEVPERRVQRRYVDLAPTRSQRDLVHETPEGPIRWTAVGRETAPAFVVVFIHGRNGDRRLGMNDWTFGGNFNRLKNLAGRSGGLYASADGGALGAADARKVAALVEDLKRRSGGAPLVLACASMGSALCWTLLRDRDASSAVDALAVLGGNSSLADLDALPARPRPLPVFVAHGTRDRVYPFDRQRAFVEALLRRPGYPARFVGFDGGNHGTPIRMTDWRNALGWLLGR